MPFYPYLIFGGNCREAFTRYHDIFGGDLNVMSMDDMPADEQMPDAPSDMVMHASLTIDGGMLMGSDDPSGSSKAIEGAYVHYGTADVAEAERVFGALADGGEVQMALEKTFWSDAFGMCRDRFGVLWMVDAEPTGSS